MPGFIHFIVVTANGSIREWYKIIHFTNIKYLHMDYLFEYETKMLQLKIFVTTSELQKCKGKMFTVLCYVRNERVTLQWKH